VIQQLREAITKFTSKVRNYRLPVPGGQDRSGPHKPNTSSTRQKYNSTKRFCGVLVQHVPWQDFAPPAPVRPCSYLPTPIIKESRGECKRVNFPRRPKKWTVRELRDRVLIG
jgi:hypothetical protein